MNNSDLMESFYSSSSPSTDVMQIVQDSSIVDVPYCQDILPDGREVIVIGDVEGCKKFNHLQGDNPYGFKGTCGLVSCEDVLRQFGLEITEKDVVDHALKHGLCSRDPFNPNLCGGTDPSSQAQILTDFGVPAHVELGIGSLEHLAEHVKEGKGIIIEVNAGELWDDPNYFDNGQANHAIVVTGVARSPQTGQIEGFFINDSSGRNLQEDAGRFIDADLMKRAWLDTGSMSVVTDRARVV